MEYQKADRDYIRLSIAFEGRAKQANELLRNFDSISELFEAVKNFDSDILTMIKREQAEKLRLTASDVYIDDFISVFDICEEDINVQQTPLGYDGLCEEFFSMITSGGKMILLDNFIMNLCLIPAAMDRHWGLY